MYNKLISMKRLQQIALASFFAICVLYISGCGYSTMRYINPQANFSYIKSVAVLPFNNMSGDGYAGEKIRGIMTIDLLRRGVFDVVEQGEVNRVLNMVLRASGADAGSVVALDKEVLKLLGEKMGVQAVFMGSVDEFGSTVSISTRLIDTASGTVLWQAKTTVYGGSMWRTIMGVGAIDSITLSRMAVSRALNSLL